MQLSKSASSQPHATYSAMILGLSFCWIFLSKTVKDLSSFLAPLEKAIRFTCRPSCVFIISCVWAMLALLIHLGGLGIFDPKNCKPLYPTKHHYPYCKYGEKVTQPGEKALWKHHGILLTSAQPLDLLRHYVLWSGKLH